MTSLPVVIRKVIGRRGLFLARSILSGLRYHIGFYEYADSTSRLNGISALMCTYNEEDWVEPSIMSIKDLVDEYVVVDSSDDKTPEIVTQLAIEHGLNIKLIKMPAGDIVKARNTALRNSSYKWLMQIDADMVFYERGVYTIRDLIETLNPRRHYVIYWKYLLLCGDIYHVCGENPYHVEHWMITYSSRLSYKYLDYGGGKFMDALIPPLTLYKPIYLDSVLGIHLARVRSPEKLAIKHIRLEYRKQFMDYTKQGLNSYEAAGRIARELYNVDTLQELGLRLLRDLIIKLPKYDESKYGPLPRILVDHARKHGRL
ncbi:MAG: glycosyltransferase [Desulfurococcaceae archaeon]